MSEDQFNDKNLVRKFTHLSIPAEIWLRKDISIIAKCLWAEIYSQENSDLGGCDQNEEFFLKFFHIKRTRFYQILNELKDAGLLETVSSDGRKTIRRTILGRVS